MADVRVRNVVTENTQPSGRSWPVEIVLNNNETVALVTNPKTCNPDGIGARGHKTDVTLEVRDQGGDVVWSQTKFSVCVPVNEPSTVLSGNKRVTFNPDVDVEGTVTLHASCSVINEDRTHSHSPVGVSIVSPDETQDPTDPSPGGNGTDGGESPFGGLFGGDGGGGGGGGNDPFGIPVDEILIVVALFALAMIARSGSEILG